MSSDYYLECHCNALFHTTSEDYIICNPSDIEMTELPNLVYHDDMRRIHRFINYEHAPPPSVEIEDILPLDL